MSNPALRFHPAGAQAGGVKLIHSRRLSAALLNVLRPLIAVGAVLGLGGCAVYPPPPVAVGQGTLTYSTPTVVTPGYAVDPYAAAPYPALAYPAVPYYGNPYYVGPPISLGLWFGHGGGHYHGWGDRYHGWGGRYHGWGGHRGGHWAGHAHGGGHRGGGGRHR